MEYLSKHTDMFKSYSEGRYTSVLEYYDSSVKYSDFIKNCILLWGHHAKQTKQLLVIQKRTVRIVTGSKYNSHTESLFKKNLLKVNGITYIIMEN